MPDTPPPEEIARLARIADAKLQFEEFFQHYLECALYSSTLPELDKSGPLFAKGYRSGMPLDKYFKPKDFDPDALAVLRAHALSFWSRMWFYLDYETGVSPRFKAACTPKCAGWDFWLTQNGHGDGFWSGAWAVYGELLTKLAGCYPEINLQVTDDEKVTL